MKNKLPLWVGGTLVVYWGLFLILQLCHKDQDFSELENRKLASKPSFSTETLLNGTFGDDFETYIADQFPLRNSFISLKSESERLLQKKENNGVFLGKDGYLLQDFDTPDMDRAMTNAGYVNAIAENFNVYVALAPTATKVLEAKLPSFAGPYDEGKYISDFYSALSDKVHKVNILETLQDQLDSGQQLYYKTDHHWTTLGAYYAYTSFCKEAGLTPTPLSDFDIETVSHDFYGTLFSKGNFTFIEPDDLQIFYPKEENPVTVTYEVEDKTTDSLYEYSHLETKDKYSVFLDNNHPLIHIQSAANNGRKILILKDSYANSFIPFLTANYEDIYVLDLRYANMPIQTFANEHGIKDILLLYNVQNFSSEGKLSLLLK
ncbi:MAG: hypothetical protein J6F30_04075 [Cellulosilyticum sp.]|nr:hypothetical protein [Cellulosilyticum sp.]